MRLKLLRRPSPGTVIATVALIVASSGVAVAAIPAENTITACYANARAGSQPHGALRVIDGERGEQCAASEAPISWNSRGPAGTAGPPGSAGSAKAWA